MSESQWIGDQLAGPATERGSTRSVDIPQNAVTSHEQRHPVKVFWGRIETAGTYITPPFSVRSERITQKVKSGLFSSKRVTVGYNYFGSFAAGLAIVPVHTLHKIRSGDDVIWEGPITSASADSEGKSILATDLGTIHFYWGTGDQVTSSLLSALGAGLTIPAYPFVCYFVAYDLAWGSNTSPPMLSFEISSVPDILPLAAHSSEGDVSPAEALYDFLTDDLYGAGLDPALIDENTFTAAAEQLADEGLWLSPEIDRRSSLREFVGDLLDYIDGFLRPSAGRMSLFLNRTPASFSGLPSFGPEDFLEEPETRHVGFGETWNETLVEFTDRANAYEKTVQPHEDPANFAIVGRQVSQSFRLPWIRRRDVAAIVAERKGARGGIPLSRHEVVLLAGSAGGREVGDIVRLQYPATGLDSWVRIMERIDGGPEDPGVKLVCLDEAGAPIESLPAAVHTPITPPDSQVRQPITGASPRIGILPEALREGAADGFFVATNRTGGLIVGQRIFFSWDPLQDDFREIADSLDFPAACEVVFWKQQGSHWLLRVAGWRAADLDSLLSAANTIDDAYLVWMPVEGGAALTAPGWAKIRRTGIFKAGPGDTVDVEIETGAWSTLGLRLADGIATERAPSRDTFGGGLGAFVLVQTDDLKFARAGANHPDDVDLVRSIAVTLADATREQSLNDAAVAAYDKVGDAYNPSWGPAAPTAYELYDTEAGAAVAGGTLSASLEDIDAALGRMFAGEQTAEDLTRWEDVDNALGAYFETGYYTP